MSRTKLFWSVLLLASLACNIGTSAPPTQTTDLFATLSASTPNQNAANPDAPLNQTPTFAFNELATTSVQTPVSTPQPSSGTQPSGKIAFTCQIYKAQASNQICIINADGTGFRRLTADDSHQHYYPSMSPDGGSVLYSAFRQENIYEIYEINLATNQVRQLTNKLGVANAPEVSPDGKSIVFTLWTAASNRYRLMVMDRNGENVNNIPRTEGWDPTWSPDGKLILFAGNYDGTNQLYTVNLGGRQLHKVSNLPAIRGRSDWSPDGGFIVTYSGEPWKREVYIMDADGSNARVLSPTGGNAQGPSISPDGQWVAFTAYYDHYGDDHGCEIYIVRIDGTDLRRLTDNDYCDYQPRWGP